MMKPLAYTLISSLSTLGAGLPSYSHPPELQLSHASTRVRLYVPQAKTGFYQGTRFDWSGAIAELESQGHSYFGPWFARMDPQVHDFIYDSSGIVVGPCTAMTGPVEEFTAALGYEEAKPGETFVKIGVGILRRPDAGKYDSMRLYEVVDSGHWKTQQEGSGVVFRQEIQDPSSGYGYRYEKSIHLSENGLKLTIDHRLVNTGRQPIQTDVYDHNFAVIDRQAPGPGLSITVPFQLVPHIAPEKGLVQIRGNRIEYVATLKDENRVYATFEPPPANRNDYDLRIENARRGASLEIRGDRPLSKLALWSIRSVFAIEPFIEISVDPGKTITWRYEYTFGHLPPAAKP